MYIIKNKGLKLILVSFLVFLVLNLVENYFHYNIGRNRDKSFKELSIPSYDDWVKIIFIMFIFAFLQGFFTYFIDR